MRLIPSSLGNEVHLWTVPLDVSATALEEVSRTLSAQEQERAMRLHGHLVRRRFISTHGWLRWLLGSYLGCEPGVVSLTRDALGKPRIGSGGPSWLRFSLSHSSDLAVIAVAREREVGVDVERLVTGFPLESMERRCFSPWERRLLTRAGPNRRQAAFLALWTRKEAYLKATGTGLHVDPAFVDMGSVTGRRAMARRDAPGESWCVRGFFAAEGYAAAVAVQGLRRGTCIPPRATKLWWEERGGPHPAVMST